MAWNGVKWRGMVAVGISRCLNKESRHEMLMTLVSLVVSDALMQVFVNICNVGITIINHPPVITIDSWYKPFPNGWFLTLLYPHYTCRDLPPFFQDVRRLHWKFQAKERLGCRHCQCYGKRSLRQDQNSE